MLSLRLGNVFSARLIELRGLRRGILQRGVNRLLHIVRLGSGEYRLWGLGVHIVRGWKVRIGRFVCMQRV